MLGAFATTATGFAPEAVVEMRQPKTVLGTRSNINVATSVAIEWQETLIRVLPDG
jgi:hypothetical protein